METTTLRFSRRSYRLGSGLGLVPSFGHFLVAGLLSSAFAIGGIHSTVLFPSGASLTASLANPVAVAAADLDGDGWKDLVVSLNNPEKIVWYRNAGNGSFAATQYVVTTSPASAALTNVVAADVNGDGRADVVFWGGALVRYTPNLGGSDPAAQFGYNAANETANQLPIAATGVPETIVGTADINGDGRIDILSATSTQPGAIDNSVAWVPNLAGGFGSRIIVSNAGGSPTSLQGVDLDNDGDKDLLVTSASDNTLAWFQNLGGGSFGAGPGNRRVISNSVSIAQCAAVGDLNGDGWPDVVVGGVATTTVRWHAHNGSAVSPVIGSTANTVTAGVNGAFGLAVRDMNSDGWLDIVIIAAGGNKVVWCENLGAGNFGAASSNQKLIGSLAVPISMEATDLDQNGTVDVVANANSGASVTSFRNHGGQTAVATVDTAPATLMEGRRDDVLRIALTNRGVAGDSAAQLGTLSLHLANDAGTSLTILQANALIDKVAIHLDADSSGTFDPAVDLAVGTVTQLNLVDGLISFPLAGAMPANIQVAPGATREYFVVVKMAANATLQSPSAVRVTHRSVGTSRSVFLDAASSAVLTSELAGNSNVTSALVTASPQNHTYTDWSYISFDAAGLPGTLPSQSLWADGIPNVLKYGLAIDGLSPNAPSGLPVMLRQGGAKVFRHLRPAFSVDVSYQYDISRNMAGWQPAVENVDYVKQEITLPTGEVQRDLIILGAWQQSFMRVRVVLAN